MCDPLPQAIPTALADEPATAPAETLDLRAGPDMVDLADWVRGNPAMAEALRQRLRESLTARRGPTPSP